MLIDMHAHTAGISRCCRADGETVLRAARDAGIDGLILCNHYQEEYVTHAGPAEFAERYIAEYLRTFEAAEKLGVKLFFGVEVTAKKLGGAHILIYGPGPELVWEHPEIYEYPLEDMHAIAHAKGGLVVQAHPFRRGGHVRDLRWLDGVEVNCHPLYEATCCGEMLNIAREARRLVTCGGDYHADTYRPVCGTYFPDDATDSAALIAHLKDSPEIKLCVHELRTDCHRDVTFIKPR